MNNPTIGIRIANGTYFPILKEEDRDKKKLILSPVKEDQKDVKIDIFRGEGEGMYEPIYVASLILNNINQEDGKVPEIELLLNVTEGGILDAQAYEPISGTKQFLSVSLDSIDSNADFYDMQDSSSEDNDSVIEPRFSPDFDDNSGMDDKESNEESNISSYDSENKKKKKGGKIIMLILLILLLLLLGFLAYSLIMKPSLAKKSDRAASQPPVEVALGLKELKAEPPAQEAIPETKPEPPVLKQEPVQQPAPAATPKKDDIRYLIKWGDTLWDISNTYYRTPWLYKKIAKDNNIKNPDRIYAGFYLTIKPE